MAYFRFAYIEIDHSWLLLSELYTKMENPITLTRISLATLTRVSLVTLTRVLPVALTKVSSTEV